jgi:hypothetical protein
MQRRIAIGQLKRSLVYERAEEHGAVVIRPITGYEVEPPL